jgi:acyl carrier protein
MAIREELLNTIAAWHLPVPVSDDTPLVQSGLLDSVALFNLVLWIEQQTGQPLNPAHVDIQRELNTVTSILNLVTRLQQSAGRG